MIRIYSLTKTPLSRRRKIKRDVLKLQIYIEDGIIKDAKFKTFGCGSAIASSNVACEMLKNMRIEEVKEINNEMISEYLKLPPIKRHCSLLAETAIKEAIKDYKKKN